MKGRYCIGIFAMLGIAFCFGCSTKKNTAATRAFHELTTRYNVYFNAEESYNEALKNIFENTKDNYNELLPMFLNSSNPEDTVVKKQMGGAFDRVVEKTAKAIDEHSISAKPVRDKDKINSQEYRDWLRQNEFNPFIDRAWLLMGKAHVQNKDYIEAVIVFEQTARLFSYDIDVVSEAQLWMMRAYTEMGWLADAESLSLTLKSRSLPKDLKQMFSECYTFLLLRQKHFQQAVPFLKETIVNNKGIQKKRLQFLLGQIYTELGEKNNAYRAFESVKGINTPYDMVFHALMAQAKVSSENTEETINHLKKISKNNKNKNYLDQIYIAIGDIYLLQNNFEKAVENYLLAEKHSSHDASRKALAQIALADIYFDRKEFVKAEPKYSEALSALPRNDKNYPKAEFRSFALKELTPHLLDIQMQDSLLHLARLPRQEQLDIIDKHIRELKKKKKEESQNAERNAYLAQQQTNYPILNEQQPSVAESMVSTANNGGGEAEFYFYNPQLVAQGKNEFRRHWGNRPLQDNWRLADGVNAVRLTSEQTSDSTARQLLQKTETSAGLYDPEYYLQQLPLSDEAKTESHQIIDKALLEGGLSAKNTLEDSDYALQLFLRHLNDYPKSKNRMEVYYQLFQLYSKTGNRTIAQSYKAKIIAEYPKSDYAAAMSDPFYEASIARFAQSQDSLYQDTYQAYSDGKPEKVHENYNVAKKFYRNGNLMPKFMLLNALAFAQQGDEKNLKPALEELVGESKETGESQLAQNILTGLSEGKTLAINASVLSQINGQNYRENNIVRADTIRFGNEKHVPHSYLLLFQGNIRRNDLLFSVSDFNFSRFKTRTFSTDFLKISPFEAIQIGTFESFDEANLYAQIIASDSVFKESAASGIVPLVISDTNLKLLYGSKTINEYIDFYNLELRTQASDLQEEKNNFVKTEPSEPQKELSLETETGKQPQIQIEEKKTANPVQQQTEPRLSIEEQKSKLESKAVEALRQENRDEKSQNRNDLLKQREQERQERLKQREKELKEREKARKEELKQREIERKQKLKEQEKLRKEKLKERERLLRQQR